MAGRSRDDRSYRYRRQAVVLLMVYVNERLDHLPSSHFYSDVGVNPAVNLGYLRYLPILSTSLYRPFAISRGTRGVHILLIPESAIHRCHVLSLPDSQETFFPAVRQLYTRVARQSRSNPWLVFLPALSPLSASSREPEQQGLVAP